MKAVLKKVNKKIIASVFLIIVAMCALAGCGSSEKSTAKSPSAKDIRGKIKQAVDISQMKEGDAAKLKKLYDISSDEIEDFVFYMAPSNIKADEILVIKAKDANSISSIKDKISKRIEKQSTSFKDYLPDEYFIIQKNIVKTKDKYVIFVISKDAEKISNAFDESFK